MKPILLLAIPLLLIICCSDITIHDHYDFSKPSDVTELPQELLEVSGISHVKNDLLACVMDEDAVIFYFDIKSKKITDTYRFGQKGDYEDLVVADEKIYVLKSDGNLYLIDLKQPEGNKREFNTGLSSKFDTEGLCYDKKQNRLLIACKESGQKQSTERMIYGFDLSTESLSQEPVIRFSKDNLNRFIETHKKDLPKSITDLRNEEKMDKLLSPSAIAIHPETEELYIVSSRSGLVLISDMKGSIINMINLPKDLFNQPEGITFTPESKLYISNEGKKNPATVVGFSYTF